MVAPLLVLDGAGVPPPASVHSRLALAVSWVTRGATSSLSQFFPFRIGSDSLPK